MSDTIAEAIERRARLAKELALLDQYIELHERLFGDARKPISATAYISEEGDTVAAHGRQEPRTRNDPKAIADAAERIICEAGRPIKRGELVRRIEATGLTLNTSDKGKYIGTILWRERQRFENIEGEGYWVVGGDRTTQAQQELGIRH